MRVHAQAYAIKCARSDVCNSIAVRNEPVESYSYQYSSDFIIRVGVQVLNLLCINEECENTKIENSNYFQIFPIGDDATSNEKISVQVHFPEKTNTYNNISNVKEWKRAGAEPRRYKSDITGYGRINFINFDNRDETITLNQSAHLPEP